MPRLQIVCLTFIFVSLAVRLFFDPTLHAQKVPIERLTDMITNSPPPGDQRYWLLYIGEDDFFGRRIARFKLAENQNDCYAVMTRDFEDTLKIERRTGRVKISAVCLSIVPLAEIVCSIALSSLAVFCLWLAKKLAPDSKTLEPELLP